RRELDAGRLGPAEQAIALARRAAGRDPKLQDDVMYTEAMLRSYRGDFQGAAQHVLGRIPAAAARPAGDEAEFWMHNRMIFLREALNDPAGMVVEALELCAVGERPGYAPERATRLRLDCLWHRAHALRTFAQAQSGGARAAALRYAQEARAAFAQLARES